MTFSLDELRNELAKIEETNFNDVCYSNGVFTAETFPHIAACIGEMGNSHDYYSANEVGRIIPIPPKA